MTEKICKKCNMLFTKMEDRCSCDESLCRSCCECEEKCKCGCKEDRCCQG